MHTSLIITHDTLHWTHRRGYLTLAVCVRVAGERSEPSARDTKGRRGVGRKKKKKRIMHPSPSPAYTWHSHTGQTLETRAESEKKKNDNIVWEQSCVIFLLLSVQTVKKKSKAATQRKLNPHRGVIFFLNCGKNLNETLGGEGWWMVAWEGGGRVSGVCLVHFFFLTALSV